MPTPTTSRHDLFRSVLSSKIAILDGAMGTMVHALGLDERGFRGERFADHHRDLKNCLDVLPLTQPDAIRDILAAYFAAGSDIVESCTFGTTSVALADFGLQNHTRELNLAAARLAREAAVAAEAKDPSQPRFVAGSIGPTNKQLSIAGNVSDPGHRDVTFDEMVAAYREQIEALVEGGVDILLATREGRAERLTGEGRAGQLGLPRIAGELYRSARHLRVFTAEPLTGSTERLGRLALLSAGEVEERLARGRALI